MSFVSYIWRYTTCTRCGPSTDTLLSLFVILSDASLSVNFPRWATPLYTRQLSRAILILSPCCWNTEPSPMKLLRWDPFRKNSLMLPLNTGYSHWSLWGNTNFSPIETYKSLCRHPFETTATFWSFLSHILDYIVQLAWWTQFNETIRRHRSSYWLTVISEIEQSAMVPGCCTETYSYDNLSVLPLKMSTTSLIF